MPNTLLTPTVIANELLMRFKNNLRFASGCSHEYDEKFDKIGDTYNLRVPPRFIANDGADITSQVQDVKEYTKPLTIDTRKNVAFKFTSKDLTLTVDRFADRYLNSAAVSLANAFEVSGLTMAYQQTPNLVGTPGVTPATSAIVLDCGVKLDNNSCPMDDDRSLVVNPSAQGAMVEALKGLFQNSTEIGKQYKSGRMGTALGFDWAMSQNIRSHTVGTWGTTPVTTGASSEGDTTISISGLTATTGTVAKGDKFTVASVYAVNPVSGDQIGTTLQQFTATAAATANGSGIAVVSVTPKISATGGDKTVSALPGSGATITKVGTASTAYPMNIAYHKHAFCYATVPLELPKGTHFGARSIDKDSGLSIRIISDYTILTDEFITRCDIAYGWAARRPEWAVALVG